VSIYGTRLSLSNDEHEDGCAIWVEVEPGCFEHSGNPCDCGIPRAPLVYEGSHVLPGDDDRRGGGIDVAEIPNHIEREGREPPFDYLRLSVYNLPSIETYKGKPYVAAGNAAVVLDRLLVEELRDTLTAWLDRSSERPADTPARGAGDAESHGKAGRADG
jgi:hypothetical protein